MRRLKTAIIGLTVAATLGGCTRGSISDQPPIHLQQNMDFQNRFEAQEENDLFADKRGMRPRVAGTVPWGYLKEDDHVYRGLVDGQPAVELPKTDDKGRAITLDTAFLNEGKERYGIFCTPCHDGAGTGDGIVVQRGFMKPPSIHEERIRGIAVGGFYDIVTNGVRNMPAYGEKLSIRERWAVAAYVRALQISRSARLNQVPADKAAEKRWEVR
ncbi:MAG: mono/diheme cytochrome c family protein [Myxococcota bacterium]|jgi:mono/diheme cytochrome c family protein